jgi:hypothetical protein
MQALNSLLVRAGLPLAPGEQTLMARVIELDAQNKRLQADVQQERCVRTTSLHRYYDDDDDD